jgi:chromosome partitioning protein
MKIVTVAINKGGTGKTTITKSLATEAVAAGLNVLVLDMDSQENARKWGDRRKARDPHKILPLVKFTTETSLPDELAKAKHAGCDLVIIDTPPGRSTEAVAAVESAHLVLIPFEADDQDSFDGIPKIARLARAHDKPAIGLLNKVTPNSFKQIETGRAICGVPSTNIAMSPVVLHRYTQHRDANPKGLTAQEMEPRSVAAAEIKALWEWICAQLQDGTNEQLRFGTNSDVQPGADEQSSELATSAQ